MTSPGSRASKLARVAGKLRCSKAEGALVRELQKRRDLVQRGLTVGRGR